MFLACSIRDHPTEVRADLQRYYGISLDDIGDRVSVFQAASCLACVPLGSNLAAAINPEATWGSEAHLLHAILSSICGKEIAKPWGKKRNDLEYESIGIDEFADWYNQDWRDTGCQIV